MTVIVAAVMAGISVGSRLRWYDGVAAFFVVVALSPWPPGKDGSNG